jgi:hypothetical protein
MASTVTSRTSSREAGPDASTTWSDSSAVSGSVIGFDAVAVEASRERARPAGDSATGLGAAGAEDGVGDAAGSRSMAVIVWPSGSCSAASA